MTPLKNSSPQRELLYRQIDDLRPLLPKGDLLYTAGRLVPVQFHKFGSRELGGALIGGKVIVINASRPLSAQRFSLAHELVHFFLHRHLKDHSAPFLEWQANEGAAELLMPRYEVSTLVQQHRHDLHTLPGIMARRFGVSSRAAQNRLHSLGYLPRQSTSIDI